MSSDAGTQTDAYKMGQCHATTLVNDAMLAGRQTLAMGWEKVRGTAAAVLSTTPRTLAGENRYRAGVTTQFPDKRPQKSSQHTQTRSETAPPAPTPPIHARVEELRRRAAEAPWEAYDPTTVAPRPRVHMFSNDEQVRHVLDEMDKLAKLQMVEPFDD